MATGKRVLLLTASYGTGHVSAAKAVDAAFRQACPDVETRMVDLVTFRDGPRHGPTRSQALYNFSMRKPFLWDLSFRVSTNRLFSAWLRFLVRTSYYRAAERLIDEFNPDVIVSTYMFWSFLLEAYKRRRRAVPTVCVITDSRMIHDSWFSPAVDRYCVMDEDTRGVFAGRGFRNVEVTGFPVNAALEQPVDRVRILGELGLREDRRTVLVSVGLGALERFEEILDHLRTRTGPFQLLVVCGRFQDLHEKLKKKTFAEPCALLGWTDRMADFIRASDLVVCKGGGAIVSETLSAGKPVFIPVTVPGQERGNVEFILEHRLGFHEPGLEGALSTLDRIVSGELPLAPYADRISRIIPKSAAAAVVRAACTLAGIPTPP